MTRTSVFLLLLFSIAGTSLTRDSAAQDEKPAKPKASAKSKRQPLPFFNVSRESAALEFVSEHHPELVDLLAQLKERDNEEYQRVVRELFQTSTRLAGVQQRNPERYALELEQWKLKSRIQVLAARVSMSDSEALKDELRKALQEQVNNRLDLLRLEQRQLSSRLERVDALVADLEKDQAKHVQRQFDQLTGAIKKSRQERIREKLARKKAGGAKGAASQTTGSK